MVKELSIFQKCFDFTEAREARARGMYPFFRPIEKAEGSEVVIEGRRYLMFGSNNYLGLALDERVRQAAIEAISLYGTSCSGSRFMNGTLDLHEKLESRLAEFTGHEAALCFTTGYQTNLGSISAIIGQGEHIFSDKYNHASIMDGIFLARGFRGHLEFHRYRHNSPEDLEKELKKVPLHEPKIIVSDGVFSMEGDIIRLPEIRELADRYEAALYLDEAHALGVVGSTGRGSCEHYGYRACADLLMCTFSKTFGSIGGFIAGRNEVIDYIKHFSRPLIFSASMPPANIAAVLKSLEIIIGEPERVRRLQAIAAKMTDAFRSRGFDIGLSETPIIPLVIGSQELTLRYWQALFERGIYVNPVLSPAVPPNRCLIRTSYMAIHTDDELDHFLDVAAEEAARLGIIA
jgi:8-amino-7-oxononanoate synthase